MLRARGYSRAEASQFIALAWFFGCDPSWRIRRAAQHDSVLGWSSTDNPVHWSA